MTKKDYQAFARKLHSERASFIMACKSQAPFDRIVTAISDVFAEDNVAFDYARFREACETGTCKGMKS